MTLQTKATAQLITATTSPQRVKGAKAPPAVGNPERSRNQDSTHQQSKRREQPPQSDEINGSEFGE
jgi:hypothetical protein